MKLTREKGMRMWGGGGGSSYSYGRGGGGESPSLDGFVSTEYYNQNFELLYKQEVTAGGTTTTTFMTAAPNIIVPVGTVTDETTQTTTVTSLVGPVAKNAIVLGNIMMVYDQTNNAIKVVNRDGSTAANFYATGGVSALGYSPGGGGGGDPLTEPLASINSALLGMPTAAGQVITWNGTQWIFDIPQGGGGGGGTGTVTSITAGTGLSGGTITTMGTIAISSEYQGYIEHGQTAYGWGNHANAGYLTQSSLNGYATQQWADQRYVTIGTQQYITAQKTFTASLIASNDIYLNKYEEQQWVNFNNGLKNFSFGQEQGGDSVLYASGNVNFYTNINSNPYALFVQGSSGNVGIGNNNPTYKFDVSGNIHTNSAYYLDGRLFANNDTNNNNGLHIGYGFAAADLPTTLWGDEISFRSIDGTFGECTTIGNKYGIMGTDFIGVTNKFRFEYDSQNNTVWVLKADGSAVHFASLGGVSSLGTSSSGTPNISSMNLDLLTVNGTATINTLAVTNSIESLDVDELTIVNQLMLNGKNIYMDGGDIQDAYNIQASRLRIGGSTASIVSKIYWDGTYLQVQIGTTTYKFRPDATA